MVQFDPNPSQSESTVKTLYETDFYAWTQGQAELLRNHHWSKLDLPNLIEGNLHSAPSTVTQRQG